MLRPSGLYCPAGDFYIDPWQPVERAIITHAHGDHARSGSNAYYAHTDCVPLLAIRLATTAPLHALAYGEERRFGSATVSLHPAGHILGSSQVRIEVPTANGGREVWVVSGDYKRDPDPTCTLFEVVPCDTFITEATFAAPIYRWQGGDVVAREILDWWQSCADSGACALLFCYSLGKAQRVLAELARLRPVPMEPVLLHGAMMNLTAAYRQAGVEMLATEKLGGDETAADFSPEADAVPETPADVIPTSLAESAPAPAATAGDDLPDAAASPATLQPTSSNSAAAAGFAAKPKKKAKASKAPSAKVDYAGRLVLAPPSAYRSPWMRRFRQFETGFASGWVRVRGALRQRGHDRGFVLSDHADWPSLLRTVAETGAKHTLVTHGRSDLLVRWLIEHGHSAAPLRTAYGDDEAES